MSDTVIRVENLGKKFYLGKEQAGTLKETLHRIFEKDAREKDAFWAIKDISFEVKQGDVLGIIGRNGAGKSTLLKILSRITPPTTGTIEYHGRIASLLEVGTGFHPELSGKENIYLNGTILGMKRKEIDRKLDEIIDFSGIETFIDTPVKRYSSGMYVRLAFAVAAHLDPEILILDEVLAVGDAEFQKKCLGKMKDVSANEGRTVLFVSHNLTAVLSLCNKGIYLKDGIMNIGGIGEIRSIADKYLSDNAIIYNEGVVELKNAIRSKGKGHIIEKAWIENCKGEIVNSIFMGDDFFIKFSYKSEEVISNPIFGFGIENSFGQRVTSFNNLVMNKVVFNDTKAGIAICHFKNPNLMPGQYFVSISIVSNRFEWIDFIEQSLSFNIVGADVYGTGKILDQSQGLLYLQGEIKLIEE